MQYLLSSAILAVLAADFWVHPERATWLVPAPIWISVCAAGCAGGVILFLRRLGRTR